VAEADFTIEALDSAEGSAAIVLDAQSNPHIAYIGQGQSLKYARKTATGWKIEALDSAGCVALAIGPENHPHVAYELGAAPSRSVKYAFRTKDGWAIETVEEELSQTRDFAVSLALDAQGNAHLTYDTIKYAHRTASGWKIETVKSNEFSQEFGEQSISYSDALLMVGAGGIPSVVYSEFRDMNIPLTPSSYAELVYATLEGNKWISQTIGSWGPTEGGGPHILFSAAQDVNGDPHVAFCASLLVFCSLRYVYKKNGNWLSESVEPVADPWRFSLALDSQCNPHLTFSAQGGLGYASKSRSGWNVRRIDVEAGPGSCALAIDLKGAPHIAYVDKSGLKYAFAKPLG
jgi:hypothetical protein